MGSPGRGGPGRESGGDEDIDLGIVREHEDACPLGVIFVGDEGALDGVQTTDGVVHCFWSTSTMVWSMFWSTLGI